jgi:hypothetical protein
MNGSRKGFLDHRLSSSSGTNEKPQSQAAAKLFYDHAGSADQALKL